MARAIETRRFRSFARAAKVREKNRNPRGVEIPLSARNLEALGPKGVAHLKALVEDLGRTQVPVPPRSEWQVVGRGSGGTRYAHELEERARQSTVEMALKDIAFVQGVPRISTSAAWRGYRRSAPRTLA